MLGTVLSFSFEDSLGFFAEGEVTVHESLLNVIDQRLQTVSKNEVICQPQTVPTPAAITCNRLFIGGLRCSPA